MLRASAGKLLRRRRWQLPCTDKRSRLPFTLQVRLPHGGRVCVLAVHWHHSVQAVKARLQRRLGERAARQQLWLPSVDGWRLARNDERLEQCIELQRAECAVMRLSVA